MTNSAINVMFSSKSASRLAMLALFALLATTASACIISSEDDSSLTIENASSYAFSAIHVAEFTDPDYGPDLLGPDVLLPGEQLTVFLACGDYDVLIVDELGTECELLGADLCFEDAWWTIDDTTLASCSF